MRRPFFRTMVSAHVSSAILIDNRFRQYELARRRQVAHSVAIHDHAVRNDAPPILQNDGVRTRLLRDLDRQSISAVRARPPPSSSALCRHPRPRCPQRCAAHSSERWCPHTSPPRPAETNRQRESGKAASLYFRLASRRRRLPPCTTMPKVTTLGHAVPGRFPRALLFAGGRGGLGGGENRARGLRPTERATRRPRHAPRN